METPKTKMEQICEYHAAHPEATCKELQALFGTSRQMVMYAIDPDTRQRNKENCRRRDKAKRREYNRKYRAAHRELYRESNRKWRASRPKEQNNYKRHGQTWSTAYTKAEAIRQYAAEHPEATIKEVCSALQTHSNCIAKAAPLFYKEKVRKPAPRPVPETIAAMQREQEHLLKLMASAATTAMYQELARQYSVLQMKIDYATAMANDANRELVRSRTAMEKRPLCQIVANGNGFSHH